ncbi:hypothetical protein G7083_14385 (plasmid) [Vibrio sp. HDW18]|uniref:hypothetical protein n=1 Tax=Vibrio sp. HDW18 TaxID=2714948 RepID=UPI00140E097D|nr:hypothetical protein [Vibrio sp. HDW18]QIL87049.1 hypothetical protein G7083_14385 [Vibrio sp. HDW18]
MLKWLFAKLEKTIGDSCAQRAVNEGRIASEVRKHTTEEKRLLALRLNSIEDLAQALKSEVERKEHKVFQCKDFEKLVLTRDRDGKIVVLDYHEID